MSEWSFSAGGAARKGILYGEERLRAALEASATGTFHWNIRTGELDWDESLDKLFGLEAANTVRNLKAFIEAVHPDDRMLLAEHCRACAEDGADLEVEFRVVYPDGQIRWLYNRGKTILGSDGNPEQMTGASVDITNRKHSESMLEERARISSLAADIGVALTEDTPLSDTLRLCAEAMVRHLNAAFARIWTLSADGATLQLRASAGMYTHLNGGHSRIPVGQFKIGLIAAEREPHLTNDVLNDPRVGQPDWARREGMQAFAGYPLVVGDRLVGVAAMFARHRLGDDVLKALGSVSDMLALGIERKRNEMELAAGKARNAAILETALDCFITIDAESRIVEFNRAAETTFGYRREDAIGRPMPDVIMPREFRERHYQGMRQYLETGEGPILGRRLELRGIKADGTEFPLELAVNRIPGTDVCFTATLRDISERKEWERRLEQARAEAEAASRAKSDFLASMSHELRTPLNAIIGYGEMLQEEAEDAGIESLVVDLRKIHSAGKHLLSLINDVLDLSKIEAGKMELSIEEFSVSGLVEEVVNVATPLAAQNNNELSVEIDPRAGIMRSDVTKVRQSVLNIVSNAAKFTREGQIGVFAGPDPAEPQTVLFRVRDTGIGLQPDQIANLFQPFQQAEGSASRRFGGTGLGLALTRRFCRLMGGDIDVESEYGKGSEFTIRLPRTAPQSAPPRPAALSPGTGAHEADGRNTVLIIDDDPVACDLIRRQVTREGFGAAIAHSGLEGLRLAKELRPALITLDVMMPGMDGWTVLAALKRTAGLDSIPVVMLTMVDDRNLGFALGASEFLTKPIEQKALSPVLRKYACGTPPCQALVIDDDDDGRSLVAHMMQREGWTVMQADNGQEALARLAESVPSLILLDLMMPVMDGFEFTAELRRNEAWRAIPVVVLTSKDLTDAEREFLNGRVQRVLTKGAYTREELLTELTLTARRYLEDARIHQSTS